MAVEKADYFFGCDKSNYEGDACLREHLALSPPVLRWVGGPWFFCGPAWRTVHEGSIIFLYSACARCTV